MAQLLVLSKLTPSDISELARQERSGANGILKAAQAHYFGKPLVRIDEDGGFVWLSVRSLPLAEINEAFQHTIFTAAATQLGQRISTTMSRRLTYLIFHPLQNVFQHAVPRVDGLVEPFGGVAIRKVLIPNPSTPSTEAYCEAILAKYGVVPSFIEITIHDDGNGIGAHFARHRMFQTQHVANFDVYGLDPSREWTFLKQAFERHTSSKYFVSIADQPNDDVSFRPGIGLAAMIAALRALDGYFEVRCGRHRAYRWFRRGESLTRDNLIHPDVPPQASDRVRGSLLRFFVPLI